MIYFVPLWIFMHQRRGMQRYRITRQHDFLLQGGAGGKGTWGAIGEVLDEDYFKIQDQHDPNYESEEDENVSKINTQRKA